MFDINKWRYKLTMNENLSSLLICVLVKKRKISDFYVVHPTSCTAISLSQQMFGSVCWVGTILHISEQEERFSQRFSRCSSIGRVRQALEPACAGVCEWKMLFTSMETRHFHEGKFKNGTSAGGRGFGKTNQWLGTNTVARYLSSN